MLQKLLIVGLAVTFAAAVEKEGDDPLDWLRDSIPGEPGVDYPIFSAVEQTQFDCEGKVFGGYYADPEMGCQAYHVCLLDPLSGSMYPTSFLCPNGTLFQQQIFNCDWWYNVDCAQAESLYGLAEGAFGNDIKGSDGGSGGGQCPDAGPLSDAECAGSVSNCWSPGQPDTDCPNYGLCCFDGCANTCVDSQVASDSQPDPIVTTPAYVPPPQTTPAPIVEVSTGYNYPVPENPLPIRPTTAAPVAPTQPPTLYGAPPPSSGSRAGRQGRRRGRNGRRRGRRLGRKVLRKRRL